MVQTWYYEKSPFVLWALMPNGIMLHNFMTHHFCELSFPDDLVWCYLDGVHDLAQIHSEVNKRISEYSRGEIRSMECIERVFKILVDGQYAIPKECQ